MKKYLLALMIIGPWLPGAAQQIDYKGFPQWGWGKKESTEYYQYTPEGLIPGEKYPVVLVLHGCCGEDNHATLRNAVDPSVRIWHNFGANTQQIPTYIISPKTSKGWSQHFENLKAIIDSLIDHHQADPQRIYIIGFSMGAEGTWRFLEKYPDYFAAAIPMGMDYKGSDPSKIKHIPIWTLRGEKDWWAKKLGTQVAAIRDLNGLMMDSSDWVMGVNPTLTTFKDLGHVVMWQAVSTQDLQAWMYSKINDGNKYPVVFFKNPSYKKVYEAGDEVNVDVTAHDPDGTISKIVFSIEGKFVKTLSDEPFTMKFKAGTGDQKVEVTAFDDQGKTTTAMTLVKVNIPSIIKTSKLKRGRQGAYYLQKVGAAGNGGLRFSPGKNSILPSGLVLDTNGTIRGIPTSKGRFHFSILVRDEDEDVAEKQFTLNIKKKSKNEVIVTNVKNHAGKTFPLTKVSIGAIPFNDRGDDEISLSQGTEKYEGFTLIQTDFTDTVAASSRYLEFDVDEPVTVYIAYEKLDNLFKSTSPEWLKSYRKEDGNQLVAQYYYYDVYSKDFSKGKVILQDAEEKENGVNTNYFVMIEKKK